MPIPVSISAFPVRGYSIAEEVVGVKYLDAIPFGSRGQAFKRLGRLQLQILSPEVTGCNLPGGNDPFLEPRRGAASRHRSYENNAD